MQYSGVLVVTSPHAFGPCMEALARISGVDVHHAYPDRGRAVVVLETESLEDQKRTFRVIQEAPGVLTADLVYHYADSGETS